VWVLLTKGPTLINEKGPAPPQTSAKVLRLKDGVAKAEHDG
jgi:hypothetical protein